MTTPLSRPTNAQVKVDSNALQSLSDGFNYPTFRLLNNKSRVTLSPNYLSSDPAFSYRILAVANKKGWFAAIQNAGSFGVILSPLSQLRSSVKNCSGEVTNFEPQRTISFSTSEPNIVAFAYNDTRLIVGFKSGQLVAYDTAAILTQGSNEISPLNISQHSTSPPIQIQPNHSSDPALADLVAVVRKDGNVELLNTMLERQHGWNAGDASSTPVAVSWSTKGKQLAIGLALGDIMTFSLTSKTTFQRHIPPTADGILVSLNWLAPGYTFRTSYSPATPGSDDPIHHIVHQDAKTSPVQFTKLDHSYQAPDRTKQSAYVVVLNKWDEEHTNPNADENKLLVVVGDVSCTDVEVLGNQGTQWYQQVQDNPVSIPLDKNTEDTWLLALDVDLTDTEAGNPVIYAYLNDGTVQAWYVDGSKTYAGLVSGGGAANTSTSTASTTPSPFGVPTTQSSSTFGQASSSAAVSPFGQTSNSTPSPSPFGAQPSSSGSAFGQSSFGQSNATFGSSSQTSAFGQTSSPFGSAPQQTSPFTSQSQSTSAFGGGQSSSAFGSQAQSSSAFGGGGSVFGQSSFGQPAFGQSGFGQNSGTFGGAGATNSSSTGGAFGSFGSSTNPSPFGGSFGAPATTAAASSTSGSPPITRDDSMGDSTPGFGGLSLGSSNDGDVEKRASKFSVGGGMFGSATDQSSTSSAPAFGSSDSSTGGLIKPASGFGAFGGGGSSGSFGAFGGGVASTTSAFSGGAFSAKPDQQPTSTAFNGGAFSAKPDASVTSSTGGNAFGQSGFGQSSFAKPSFGQSGFGQSGFGQPAFGKPAQPAAAASTGGSGGGFAAFASGGATGFGSGATSGKSAFASGGETGGAKTSDVSADKGSESKPTTGFGAFSGQPSAFGATASSTTTGGAFGNNSPGTPGAFGDKGSLSKPATGFGAFSGQASAFGTTTTSEGAFGSKSPEPKPVTGFGAFSGQPSAFGTSATTGGAFGDKGSESKPATGFGAFSGQGSAFGAAATTTSGGAFGDKSPEPKPATGFGAFSGQPLAFGSSASSRTAGSMSPEPSSPFGGQSQTKPAKAAGLADPLSPSPSPPPSPSQPAPSSIAPAIGTGAFSNLTRSTFKPAEGFGAFGNAVNSNSPFFKAATEKKGPAVTAFGSPGTSSPSSTVTPQSGTSSPAFGSTSKLGSGFGPKSGTSTAPVAMSAFSSTSSSGAFSAFSSGTSAFGSAASGQKASFSDLLKSKGEEQKKEQSPEKATTEEKKPKEEVGKAKEREPSPAERPLTPKTESDPATTPKAPSKVLNKDEESKKTPSVLGSIAVFTPPTPQEKERAEEPVTPPEDATSSQASSYVDVRKSEAGSSEDGSDVEHPPDDDEGFLTESDGRSEDEGGSTGEHHTSSPPPPTEVPLPRSRSGTPQAEALKKHVEEQDREDYDDDYEDEEEEEEDEEEEGTDDDDTSDSSRLSTIKEESETTTPPGSPTKKDTTSRQAIATASPSPTTSLGVGRPSTRPSRSSPLAVTAPLSGYDEDVDVTTPRAKESPQLPVVPKPRPASPKLPFGVLPQASTPTPEENKTKRPKTPPLLSNFGLGGMASAPKPPLGQPSSFTLPPPSLLGQPSAPIASSGKPSPSLPSISPASSTPPGPRPLFGNSSVAPSSPVPFTMPTSSSSISPIPSAASTVPRSPFEKPSTPGFGVPPAQLPIKVEGYSPSGSLFSTPPAKTMIPPPPSTTSTSLALPGSGLLGNSGPMVPQRPPPMGFSLTPTQAPQPPIPSPAQYQEGMQQECAVLFASMAKELEDLRRLADLASKRRETFAKAGGGSKQKEDLGDQNKWGLSDTVQFGVTMRQYEKDIRELKEGTEKQKGSIADLNKSMIKAGTRREEIARFNKAKSDNEFTKMLKSRTLGPEHSETQTQLRRNIRNLNTRVQQLEDQLKAHKKKIAEFNSGRPSLRAPTVDTINRTYRNIDLAIQQQSDDVARLTSRVKKLDLSPSHPHHKSSLGERDPRLPDPIRRPFTVTPDVAVTTAAALNAELYAHKLKTALLSARKEPLLNTSAVTAMKMLDVPIAFSTPSRGSNNLEFNTPISMQGPLFGNPPPMSAGANLNSPFDNFPEDHFSPSTPSGGSRRGGFGRRTHPPAVALRKSPVGPSGSPEVPTLGSPPVGFGSPSPLPGGNLAPKPATSSPTPSFDWGPLPSFNKTSAPSLFAPITLGNKAGSSSKTS